MDVPASTLDGVEDNAKERLAVWARRGFLGLLLAFVVTGLLGYLGVHSVTTVAVRGDYRMSLHYARIARPGLDVPWTLNITHAGGFDGPLRLDVTSSYFDMVQSQGLTPQPAHETQDGTWWHLTFEPPAGDTLVVSMGMAIQPGAHRGAAGTVRVVSGGRDVDQLHFATTLLP